MGVYCAKVFHKTKLTATMVYGVQQAAYTTKMMQRVFANWNDVSFSLEVLLEIFATCNFKNHLMLDNIIKLRYCKQKY